MPRAIDGMKQCPKCGETKPVSEFSKANHTFDKLDYWCKKCRKKYKKQWDEENPDYNKQWRENNKEHRKEYKKQRTQETREWINGLKAQRGCQECGEKRPICLDFHHRVPKEKSFEIGRAVSDDYLKEKILKEIEKCDVICSNCHRILNGEQSTRNTN